jgi:hypothetical protein
MSNVVAFFAGAFLCNSIPHLVCGLMGEPFPTPFAKPRGVGNSSPLTNFLWGMFNLLVGVSLLASFPVRAAFNSPSAALVAGALLMGVYLSRHFGGLRK